jgi:hypothetical protein
MMNNLRTEHTMQQSVQVLRSKVGVRVLAVAICITANILIWFHLPFGIPERYKFWVAPCCIVLGALFVADVFLTRIVLNPNSLRIVNVTRFSSRTIPRADIDSVTWAAGCGASVVLRGGGRGVPLPSVGYNAQGLTNVIRAWLKRTEVSP